MSFFHDQIANLGQLIALPLEIFGLTLVIIEVIYPQTAAKIARYIEKEARRYNPYLAIPALVVLIGLTIRIAMRGEDLWLFFGPVLGYIPLTCWISYRWIPTHPIGGAGIILAATGVLIEVYQVATFIAS